MLCEEKTPIFLLYLNGRSPPLLLLLHFRDRVPIRAFCDVIKGITTTLRAAATLEMFRCLSQTNHLETNSRG